MTWFQEKSAALYSTVVQGKNELTVFNLCTVQCTCSHIISIYGSSERGVAVWSFVLVKSVTRNLAYKSFLDLFHHSLGNGRPLWEIGGHSGEWVATLRNGQPLREMGGQLGKWAATLGNGLPLWEIGGQENVSQGIRHPLTNYHDRFNVTANSQSWASLLLKVTSVKR